MDSYGLVRNKKYENSYSRGLYKSDSFYLSQKSTNPHSKKAKRRKRLVLQLVVYVLQRKRSLTMVAELPGFGFAPGEDKGNESEPELETSKMVQVRPAK